MSLNYQFEIILNDIDPPSYEFTVVEPNDYEFNLDFANNNLDFVFEPEFMYLSQNYPELPHAAGRRF